MKRRTVTLVIFLLLSSLTFLCPRLASSFAELRQGTESQRRGQTRRRTRRPARPAKPSIDYSKFKHSRPEHQQKSCDSCHTIPALNVRTPGGEPSGAVDIKDYPKHESCLDCHRQQFFKGARPPICSNCHSVVSPRSDSRFQFPKRNADSQFALAFPHANHLKSTTLIQFKKVIGSTANMQATCMFCHKVNTKEFKPSKGAPADAFAPPAGTFMTTPTSHTTCFQCHFQKGVENRQQPPLATECARCHNIVATPPKAAAPSPAASAPTPARSSAGGQKPTPTPVAAHTTAQKPVAFGLIPVAAHGVSEQPWPERLAQKFPHEKDAHKKRTGDDGKEVAITCVQCHTAVRKAATLGDLREKKNHVQLPSCSSSACHTATSGTAQLRLSLYRELGARGKDEKFECALCHTPPQSLAEVPCSHYAAVYAKVKEEARKRAKPGEEDAEVEKRTKGIKQLTPVRCAGELK